MLEFTGEVSTVGHIKFNAPELMTSVWPSYLLEKRTWHNNNYNHICIAKLQKLRLWHQLLVTCFSAFSIT